MDINVSNDANEKLCCALKLLYPSEISLEKTSNYRKNILKKFLLKFQCYSLNFCPIFHSLFKRYFCTGSAIEGLQVKGAVEFGVDIVLKFLCMNNDIFMLEEVESSVSYAIFQLKVPLGELEKYPDGKRWTYVKRFFDQDNYLIGRKVLNWLQSLVDHFLASASKNLCNEIEEIKTTNSSPARTLKLKLKDIWLSVDLVPVVLIHWKNNVNYIVPLPQVINPEYMATCFLVPKPIKHAEFYHLSELDSSRLWRVHLPKAELQILHGRNYLKPVIKLIKRLRDKEKWPIPSYFIKTVAFWIVKDHPDKEYFAESNQGYRFIEMLSVLGRCLKDRHLGNIFYPDYNMLDRMNPKAYGPISNRITKIITELLSNPNSVLAMFRFRKKSQPSNAKYSKKKSNDCSRLVSKKFKS